MSGFYKVVMDERTLASGDFNAAHRWGLPGVQCPQCDAIWGGAGLQFPSGDASGLAERAELEDPHLERNFARFEYLRELVRPLLPQGVPLEPGTEFGPLVGNAWGKFGPFAWLNPWTLLVRREVLERLPAEGLRGLEGHRTELRFRQKQSPELLELELMPHGRFHPDCLSEREPPCARCGRKGISMPEQPVLKEDSLPTHLDLFRLADLNTLLIATERFAQAVQRLGPCGVAFQPLPMR
jgi:uncharacterized double-CXXCG motif protein